MRFDRRRRAVIIFVAGTQVSNDVSIGGEWARLVPQVLAAPFMFFAVPTLPRTSVEATLDASLTS
jgi:hypothetical protein